MKTIKVNKVEISYDIISLIDSVKKLSFAKHYDAYELEDTEGEGYAFDFICTTEEQFESRKASFIEKIQKLGESFEKSEFRGSKFTAKGILHKSARHILEDSGICSSYSREYGSHSYDELCIRLVSVTDNTATVRLTTERMQSSF
jgi:hypothetical protein